MKGKHTPGPWRRNIPPATKYVTVFRGRNTHVCDVIPSRGISPEEAEANLNMIVAGPVMLAALHGMLAVWPYIECNETRAARAAIQVAETGRAE